MPPPGTLKHREIDEEEVAEILHRQFGLPPAEAKAYLLLIRVGPLGAGDLAERLRTPVVEAENFLSQMLTRGLVIHAAGNPPKFTALHPRMTLTNLFKTYEKEVVQSLRDRRATVDRVVNLLTPVFEDRQR